MKKTDRIDRAIKGQEVDRIPFSVWYHFGLQHLPGEAIAAAELGFYRAFDLDFIKVMHDYPYPLPSGMEAIDSPDDWLKLKPLKPNEGGFKEQSRALKIIGKELKNEAYFIDTIFSPWSTARKLARDKVFEHQRTAPAKLKKGLDVITESFCVYIKEAVDNGLNGIFLSIGGASYELMSEKQYQEFGRPYDLMVIETAKKAAFNVLHIHGPKIMFELVNDYPVQALNWSHWHTTPNLSEARKIYQGCIIGGIEETETDSVRPPSIRKQIKETIQELGRKGVILGPGCAIPTNTPAANILAIKEAARS